MKQHAICCAVVLTLCEQAGRRERKEEEKEKKKKNEESDERSTHPVTHTHTARRAPALSLSLFQF